MKTEKRGNTYRIRKNVKGITYRLTFDHEPTEEEVIKALAKQLDKNKDRDKTDSVKKYANKYIDNLRKDKGSSTTINSYKSIVNNTPDWFLKMSLSKVDSDVFQKCINEYSGTTNSRVAERSAKTITNFKGFYKAVFKEYKPNTVFAVKAPKRVKKMEYQPTTKDIKKLLEYTKDSDYELFLRLATLGIRRGEIGALSSKDLDKDNILTINKDMVRDEKKRYYIKNYPKTSASNRRILIPKEVADMLREKSVACDFNLDTVNKYLTRTLNRLEIPHFRLHILRHFAAAYLLKNGFNRSQILEYGGWEKDSDVMDKIYAYNLDPEESQQPIANAFNTLF